MTDVLLELPSHHRARLRSALQIGLLTLPTDATALHLAAGIPNGAATADALNHLDRQVLGAIGVSAWLDAVDHIAARTRKPDLVWSGPQVPGVPHRDTRSVIGELIRGATHTLWISSFVYFDGPRAFATLATRMAEAPNLRVRMLLNIERPWGDTTATEALVTRFAHRFWTLDWPGATRPEVFYTPAALEPGGKKGSLHAKVIVADDETLLVTSANLTEAALDRNIEAGLLVRDRVLALSVARQLVGLIEHGHLTLLPDIITN